MKITLLILISLLMILPVAGQDIVNPRIEDDTETLAISTEMLNVSLAPVPASSAASNIVWKVKRNGVEEGDYSFIEDTGKVELTVILEDVPRKGRKSFLVKENLRKLAKNKVVGKLKIFGIESRSDCLAADWKDEWENRTFGSFEQAVENFWKQSGTGKHALLIISSRTESLPEDLFARLRNQSSRQSALVYYLALNPIKRNNKWSVSWCNLNWQYRWLVTLNEQYVGKQFSSFNDMINNYRVMQLYLDGAAARTEINVTGFDNLTGKKLVDQTRIFERQEVARK